MEKSIPSLSKSAVLPKRPELSGIILGKPISVLTNFYPLYRSKEQMKIYVYSITFKPEIAPTDRRRKYILMKRILQQLNEKKVFPWSVFLNNQIFSNTLIDDLNITKAKLKDQSEYEVNLKRNHDISLEDISLDNMEKNMEILRVMIAEVKDRMRKLKYHQISSASAFYNRESTEEFKGRWDIYRGFHVPCRIIENGVAVQIALRTKLVSKDSVLDQLNEIYENEKDIDSAKRKSKSEIIGRSVRTKYGNNRHWRIDDIDFNKTPNSKFMREEKEEISFLKYYYDTYNVTIKNTNQPLLVNVSKRDNKLTYLIPELVSLTGFSEREIQSYRKELNSRLYIKEQDRIDKASFLTIQMEKFPSLLNTSISSEPITAEAVLVDAPDIILGDMNKIDLSNPDREFKVRSKLYDPANFDTKTWVCIYENNDNEFTRTLLNEMREVAVGLGIIVSEPEFAIFDVQNYQREIEQIFIKIAEKKIIDFPLRLMTTKLYPRQQQHFYNYVKKLAYRDHPISNQVVNSRILNGTYKSKLTKLLIGMSAKKGNIPWRAKMFKMDVPIVMGVDICHSKERGASKSFLGFTATMNQAFNDIYSLAYPISPGQELMDGLKHCVYNALTNFMKKYDYKIIPKLFIIYRDGVSESQFNIVVESEVKQITDHIIHIREKLGINPEQWDPKIIYIIVNKRVNTRLFTQTLQGDLGSQGTGRPVGITRDFLTAHSGTLITSEITTRKYDFYLISQKITQGVAIPTHYHVLYDSSNLEPEKLYLLTYRLCFLDFNWMGGIRIPAPCHYAHKQAFMAANYVGDTPSRELASKLYYL